MTPGIAPILCAGAFAQIGDAVVSALVVDVIDYSARVLAVDIKPGEPMRAINGPIDRDVAISLPAPGARFASCSCPAASDPPIKTPRVRGVIEQFSQALGRQLAFEFAEHQGTPQREAPGSRSGLRAQLAISGFSRSNGTLFAPTFSDGANRYANRRAALPKSAPTNRRDPLFSAHTSNARRPFTAPGAAFSAIFLRGLFRQISQGKNACRHRFLPVVPKSVPSSLVAGRIAQGGRKFRSRVICRRARMKRPEMHQALKV